MNRSGNVRAPIDYEMLFCRALARRWLLERPHQPAALFRAVWKRCAVPMARIKHFG
jgi:hypothetical protein